MTKPILPISCIHVMRQQTALDLSILAKNFSRVRERQQTKTPAGTGVISRSSEPADSTAVSALAQHAGE